MNQKIWVKVKKMPTEKRSLLKNARLLLSSRKKILNNFKNKI